jgi:molybdopterin/thiamine biosynthesis adenylyltransferase/rhodanese-related sulfurtransferase
MAGMSLPPLVGPGPPLGPAELLRYSRHLLLPQLGPVGQRRLAAARVLVVGAGGLGSPVLAYLAAAGVGTVGILDDDVVDASNLQRQVVHGTADVGAAKVASAAATVAALNPLVTVVPHAVRLDPGNALDLLAGYDLVIDGTDNFATRYLVSDACAVLGRPCVWGSVLRFDGQVAVFWSAPTGGAAPVTYRDLHPEPPPPGTVPSCAEAGVLGVTCGVIGSAMGTEAVKLICGIGEPLLGRLSVYDALAASWRTVRVRRGPDAVPVTALEPDYEVFCGLPPAVTPGGVGAVGAIDASELERRLAGRDAGGPDFVLVDVREPAEREVSTVPGAVGLPLASIEADPGTLVALAAGRPVVLHCQSGVRSARALGLARAAGLDAVHLDGGILAWLALADR